MSLYRAGLKLAFFLPLGVAMPSLARRCRFHRCELRLHSALANRRDHWSNPRPQALHSQDYMLSLVVWVSPRTRQPAGW